MKRYGGTSIATTCSKCGAEVTFRYAWDNDLHFTSTEDTEHETPDGQPCDLSESDTDNAIDNHEPESPEPEED